MVFSLYLVVVTTTAGLTGEENSQDKVFHPRIQIFRLREIDGSRRFSSNQSSELWNWMDVFESEFLEQALPSSIVAIAAR